MNNGGSLGVDASGHAVKWMVTLPPEGAARQVGETAWETLSSLLPPERRKLFDTKVYLDGFDRLLKAPTDDMVVDLLNQSLAVQCLDFRATHLLVLALSPITAFTADLLRRNGTTTVHWFYEDFRQAKYWKGVVGAYDHFLAIQRGEVEAECAAKGTRFGYLPTAATIPLDRAVRPRRERPGEAAFIGFPSAYRMAVLERLQREGVALKIAGSGWDKYRGPLEPCLVRTGWTSAEESFRLLEASKLALHIPTENPQADRANCHVSPRVFDILAAGCLLLCEEAPLIRETLAGCDYKEFRGPDEAARLAKSLLLEGVPEAGRESNRETVLREHTYSRRLEFILSLGRD